MGVSGSLPPAGDHRTGSTAGKEAGLTAPARPARQLTFRCRSCLGRRARGLVFRLRDDVQLWFGPVTFRPTTKLTTKTATGKTRTLR